MRTGLKNGQDDRRNKSKRRWQLGTTRRTYRKMLAAKLWCLVFPKRNALGNRTHPHEPLPSETLRACETSPIIHRDSRAPCGTPSKMMVDTEQYSRSKEHTASQVAQASFLGTISRLPGMAERGQGYSFSLHTEASVWPRSLRLLENERPQVWDDTTAQSKIETMGLE